MQADNVYLLELVWTARVARVPATVSQDWEGRAGTGPEPTFPPELVIAFETDGLLFLGPVPGFEREIIVLNSATGTAVAEPDIPKLSAAQLAAVAAAPKWRPRVWTRGCDAAARAGGDAWLDGIIIDDRRPGVYLPFPSREASGDDCRTIAIASAGGTPDVVFVEDGGIGAGILAAGDLLFYVSDNSLKIRDQNSGDVVWSFDVGGNSLAQPMTYLINDRQFLVVAVVPSAPMSNPRWPAVSFDPDSGSMMVLALSVPPW